MGFFDPWNDNASMVSGRSSRRRRSSRSRPKKRRSRSRSRSSSRNRGRSFAGSIFGGNDRDRDRYAKNNSSRSSFFGLGGNNSRSSFFSTSKFSLTSLALSICHETLHPVCYTRQHVTDHEPLYPSTDRSSYFKRSPRQGFLQKAYKQVKRLLRDIVHWAKRHPWKVFFLLIMPLVTGGALTALLARFGLRIPAAIERMLGIASRAASGDSSGLVGEAVRMASNFGGNATVNMQRDTTSFGGDGGRSGGGEAMWGGLTDMAKKWM